MCVIKAAIYRGWGGTESSRVPTVIFVLTVATVR